MKPVNLFIVRTETDPEDLRDHTSDGQVRILMLSTMPEVDISSYPNSEKFGVWPGGDVKNFLARRESEVDYCDGER